MAALRAFEGRDLPQGVAQLGLDHLTMLHQGLSVSGGADTKAATVQQGHTQRFLQSLDAFGQGGLRHLQLCRCLGQAAAAHGGEEKLHFSVIHNQW